MAASECGTTPHLGLASPAPRRGSHATAEAASSASVVLHFPRRPVPRNRLSMRDRMEVLQWADRSAQHGFTRLVFDSASEHSGHEPGDYILIYARGALWASWGIGCTDSGLTLWNATTGVTIGRYGSMADALCAVMTAAGRL